MLLRRVIEHVKAQNWTAVVLDFFIVVLGVFIGIQVSNWNAARADNSIADGHLAEIAEDIQTHLDFHEQLYGAAVARIEAIDYIYEVAFGETLPDKLKLSTYTWPAPPTSQFQQDELDNIMGSINLIRITVSTRNGYESLISSGHLGLIKNSQLARAIQQYYGRYDDLLNTGEVFRAFRNDGASIYHAAGISVFDERPVEDIIKIARENEAFAAYLRSTREWAILHASWLEELRVESETVLSAINAELEKR